MDSGNSGSMQSSSGGDEEYDSRAESIHAFINNPSSHVGPFNVNPQLQPPPPQHNHQSHMFDPLSNYLDPMQRSAPSLSNPNSLINHLDMVWSKPGRSEPNPTDLGGLIPSSSSAQNQAFFSSQLAGQPRATAFPTVHHPLPPDGGSRGLLSVSAPNDQVHNSTAATTNNNSVARNPKKRSRASRRAPTTVLTTDTTNFRAMVQEFTGIPAPPFTSSPFPRTRLGLFGSAASSTMRSTSTHLDPPTPPYLLRPFAHKLQTPLSFVSPNPPTTSSCSIPSFPTSSMADTLLASNSTNSASNTTSINYQLSSHDLGLLKHPPPQNLLNMNMHSPILNFQSILQGPSSKYSLGNSSMLGSKPQGSLEISPTTDSQLKMGVLEEFGLSHSHVNTNLGSGLQNLVSSSSDGALSRGDINNPTTNWAEGPTTNNDGDRAILRSLSGNYNSTERLTNGKVVNYPSSSDFHGDKGPECLAARSEGMVESWINCSSD